VLTLHKILPTLILPVGLILLLLVAAFCLRRWALVWVGAIGLFLASLPGVSKTLLRSLERVTPELSVQEVPEADAILVLSGMLGPDRPDGCKLNWGEAYDRFEAGLRLWQSGKAPILVLTDPALVQTGEHETEGKQLKNEALKLGLAENRLLLIGPIGNTAQEAELFDRIAQERGWRRVFLVTSAWHMPRALERFRRTGLQILPFPVDYRTGVSEPISMLDFFPSATALAGTETFIREWIGRIYYRGLDLLPCP